jgi:Flp pilus assembly protein TadG
MGIMSRSTQKTRVFERGSVTLKGSRPRRRSESGGAAVEFAIVLPLFVGLVMGALEYGYFFFSQQVVTNAARESARAGTLIDPASGFGNAQTAAQNAAINYISGNGVSCNCSVAACPTGGSGTACVTVSQVTVGGATAINVQMCCDAVSLTGLFTPPNPFFPRRIQAQSVMRWQ